MKLKKLVEQFVEELIIILLMGKKFIESMI